MPSGDSVICDAMQAMRALLTTGLFIAAQCQLFDRSEFGDGGSFNLTCDVSRVGNVPSDVTQMYYLSIERAGVSSTQVIAVYSSVPSENLERNIPNGRAWVIEASGGTGTNNRASIKLTLHVPDARCSDAGLYSCKAGFRPTAAGGEASRSQNITFKNTTFDIPGPLDDLIQQSILHFQNEHEFSCLVDKARIEVPVLTFDHHNGKATDLSTNTVGQHVRLTCTFKGPMGLGFTWLAVQSGGTNLVPYPVDRNSQTWTPSPTNDPCVLGKYESTLDFKVPAVDTIYICVVKDGEDEASQKNFKIVVKPSNKGTHLGIRDSLWFVRNVFVMLLAMFPWSRFV